MKKTIAIEAELIEQTCECGRGVMRFDHISSPSTHPMQYEHVCSAGCGARAIWTVVYPLIKYRDKTFHMTEHTRYPIERYCPNQ